MINANEASRVREIFALYLHRGSLQPVVVELRRRCWPNKRRVTAKGKTRAVAPSTKGHCMCVGPVGFKKSEAPSALEHGGEVIVLRRRGGKLTSQKVKIAPRPYMAPALEKERPNLPLLWRNSIKKG